MAKAGGRVPADRAAAVLALGDVHRAVDQNGEAQARAGAEFQLPYAALDAVAQGREADAGELRQRTGMFGQRAAAQTPSIQLRHALPPRQRSL
jgi:hypothetical protein